MSYDLCSSRQCNVCLLLGDKIDIQIASTKLQRCEGCQLIRYCGTNHQHVDWPMHQEFCDALHKIMTTNNISHPFLLNGVILSALDMHNSTLRVKSLVRNLLGRPLLFHEEELTSFPAHCAVCFTFDGLQHCNSCLGVSYCSAEHASIDAPKHEKNCTKLQLNYSPYKVQIAKGSNRIRGQTLSHTETDVRMSDLPNIFMGCTRLKLPENPAASLKNYALFSAAADFSCISTICYAVTFMNMREYTNTKFVIFIVGATIEQEWYFQDLHTKFFFMQYPKITHLELYFIGRGVVSISSDRKFLYYFMGGPRNVILTSYCGPFEDFVLDYDVRPSLIVAFNCNFSGYCATGSFIKSNNVVKTNVWRKGLAAMLRFQRVPIVFTSLTQLEAEIEYVEFFNNAKTFNSPINVERLISIQQNPYRDMRPQRIWQLHTAQRTQNETDTDMDNENEEFCYRNGFIQAICSTMRNVNSYNIFNCL